MARSSGLAYYLRMLTTTHKEQTMSTPEIHTVQVSYFIKPNQYPTRCAHCATEVAKGEGWRQRNRESRKWDTLCNACVQTNARFIPLLTRDGQVLHGKSVANGATAATAPLGNCGHCHAIVGLVKSKTGRYYFANTYPAFNGSGARRIYDFDTHHCREA